MLGFRVGGDHPLEITHKLTLAGYNRPARLGSNLLVSVSWHLDKEGVLQEVSVAGRPVPKLATRIPYPEWGRRNAPVDRTCAGIQKAIARAEDVVPLPVDSTNESACTRSRHTPARNGGTRRARSRSTGGGTVSQQ